MAQYIDKAVIVMVIEKLIAKYKEISVGVDKKGNDWVDSVSMLNAKIDTLQSLLSTISSLEVKDNDLVEEIDYEDYIRFFKEHPDYNDGSWGFEETWTFAQYCYELGLKAQKVE